MAINCLNNHALGTTTFEYFPAAAIAAQKKKRLEFAQPIEEEIRFQEEQCDDDSEISFRAHRPSCRCHIALKARNCPS